MLAWLLELGTSWSVVVGGRGCTPDVAIDACNMQTGFTVTLQTFACA